MFLMVINFPDRKDTQKYQNKHKSSHETTNIWLLISSIFCTRSNYTLFSTYHKKW